jgi:thiamine biosynthesis lipoprotein
MQSVPGSKTTSELMVHCFRAMGSPCAFRFFAKSAWEGETVAGLALDEVRRVEAKYSRYSNESFLSHINRHANRGEAVEIDAETGRLLDFALTCFKRSGGLFDITAGVLRQAYDFRSHKRRGEVDLNAMLAVTGLEKLSWDASRLEFTVAGMQLDLGGVAKEYAADRAAAIFRENGLPSCLVDLGGDMTAAGPPADAAAWIIGIRDPRFEDELLASLHLRKGAIATSGDYENYVDIDGERHGHFINPKTGLPAIGMSSVTALASNCMAAGAAATIAMLLGENGIGWLSQRQIPFCSLTSQGEKIETLPAEPYRAAQM